MLVCLYGPMEEDMKGNGITIACMGRESTFGQMEENMRANIIMIKSTDMAYSLGQIIEDSKDTSYKESKEKT